MKGVLRGLVPDALLEPLRRFKRRREQQRDERQSTEDVFTAIYTENKWGGAPGELFSGTGTANEQVSDAYVRMVAEQAAALGFQGATFVDLGCGDFRIGARLLPFCGSYTGV